MSLCLIWVAKFHLKCSLLSKYVMFSTLKEVKEYEWGIVVSSYRMVLFPCFLVSATAPSLFLFQSDLPLIGLVGIQLQFKYWRVMFFLNQMNNMGVRLHYLTPASPMPVRNIMRENPVKSYFHMTDLVLNFCQCNLYLYFWDCMHVTADKYSPCEYVSYEYGIF